MAALNGSRQYGRAAFTLVELLVVIGIMAVLATISVAGYSAASRGMADRGVIQSTVSILRVAQQTCEIDRVPTKVLFFNRRISDSSNDDDSTRYQGTAIAIKQAGRITINPSQVDGLLVDEFADWNQSYPMMKGSDNSPGMRLFRMKVADENQDIDGCSVMVKPFVTSYQRKEYMIQSDTWMNDWCSNHRRTASDNCPHGAESSYIDNGNNYVWGFERSSDSRGKAIEWMVGDPYGVEIARIDLPKGYIFGKSAPNSDKLEAASVGEVHFNPEEFKPTLSQSVPISLMRPSTGDAYSPNHVDDVTRKMLDDDASN